MEIQKILSTVDHTLLAQQATWEDIRAICDDAMAYHTASVCIPACISRGESLCAHFQLICTLFTADIEYTVAAHVENSL